MSVMWRTMSLLLQESRGEFRGEFRGESFLGLIVIVIDLTVAFFVSHRVPAFFTLLYTPLC